MRHEIIDPSQFELTDKVVSIKRVSKTVKGGRTMRFTALVVVGDGNGHIGAGLGKATEIPEAIRKGKEDAMKKLIHVDMDANKSVPHDFIGKFGGASVLLKRAPEGTGIIAGGPARNVLEIAGIKNIRTKSLGSNNKQNVVLATLEALKQMKSPEEVARLRGKSVKSPISAIPKHRATVKALGLTKLQKTVELPNNDAVKGMIAQVSHLVKVEEA